MPITDELKAELAVGIFNRGLVQYGDFTLKSGAWSPNYADFRRTPSIREGAPNVTNMTGSEQLRFRTATVEAYSCLIDEVGEYGVDYHHLMPIPEAVVALTGMIGYHRGDSVLSRRVAMKDHGISQAIMGDWLPGDEVVLVDDLISSSGAKVQEKRRVEGISRGMVNPGIFRWNDHTMALERDVALERATEDEPEAEPNQESLTPGLVVKHAVCLVDRSVNHEAIQAAANEGLTMHTAISTEEIIEISYSEKAMPADLYDLTLAYTRGEVKSAAERDAWMEEWHRAHDGK